MNSSLGSRLREERQRLCLTQSKLGLVGGVAVNAQAHYEKDLRIPKADYLIAIATIGIDANYLLMGQRTNIDISPLSPVEQTLLKNYRAMAHLDQIAVSHISASVAKIRHIALATSIDDL